MSIPENKDVILGMIWLREQNPEIDWETLKLSPRVSPYEQPLVLRKPTVRPSRTVPVAVVRNRARVVRSSTSIASMGMKESKVRPSLSP